MTFLRDVRRVYRCKVCLVLIGCACDFFESDHRNYTL